MTSRNDEPSFEIDSDPSDSDESWAFYFTTVENDQIASILVDLNLIDSAPLDDKSNVLCFSIFMHNQTEDGLSSSDESKTLNEIEDYIIGLTNDQLKAVYVGRINSQGKIRSYFYFDGSDKLDDLISEVNNRYKNYKFDIKITEDKDWSLYFDVLYPSPVEMQIIQNGLVVENLESHGDSLKKERPVDHWIYFRTAEDREKFLDEINGQGFEIVEREQVDHDENEKPFSLQISRIDNVDYHSVNDYVIYLWEKAQVIGGDYDGWETYVIRD